MPTMRKLLRLGREGGGDGLLTQAPPNTGAGWYSLATGAWPGVHGSTNNTFHINGAAVRATAPRAFDAGVLQAETLAQAAERGGKKVAQIEWAGGRVGAINGPTVDFRSFFSGPRRGHELHQPDRRRGLRRPRSACSSTTRPGSPGRRRSPAPRPSPPTGWTNVPKSYSPAKEMRLRVLDFGIDKYGLNAYIFDSTNDGTVNYDQVLFSPTKDGATPSRPWPRASGPTSR